MYVGGYGIGMAEMEEMGRNNDAIPGSTGISAGETELPNAWLVVFLWLSASQPPLFNPPSYSYFFLNCRFLFWLAKCK